MMSNEKYRCINAFAYLKGGVKMYGGGTEVSADDSILQTHGLFFALIPGSATADEVAVEAVGSETATAAPGELRSLTTPEKRRPGRPRKNFKPAEPVVPVEPPATAEPEPVVESSAADTTED
jgi:hypothetical protein